jgi:metal-sulfur cluster biosynthetic enzyme
MNSDPLDPEPTYAHRTDDVDTKIEILRRALRAGNHELALGVADSIKDTVANQRLLDADPGPIDVPSCGWRRTGELPRAWTCWADGWNLCQVLRLTEPIGQARLSEPVDLLVSMPADLVTAPGRELRVAQLENGRLRELCSQVYGELRRGAHWLAHLVIEANVEAHGEAAFLLFCGNAAAELPDYPSRLNVRGEGVGLEIETPHYVATLSGQMGQLESLTPKWHRGGLRLSTHGDGHGEPPNLDWAHDYTTAGAFQKMRMTNWSQCPNYDVVRGPLCAIVRRFGFPHSPVHPLFTPSRLFMDLSYTFYAGVPYFLKDGRMEAARDFSAHVARDDEWYFGGRPFDAALWMDQAGRVHEGPVPPEQVDHVWGAGFFHQQSRDSIFAIYLDHRLDLPPEADPQAAAGAPLYQHLDITLDHCAPGQPPHASVWCRPMLRDGARLQTGMALVQRNAYMLAPFPRHGGAAGLELLRERLLHPLVPVAATPIPDAAADQAPDGEQPLARTGERPVDWPRKRAIWEAMGEVPENQLNSADVSLVDMGYIYDVRTRGDDVRVLMTMPHRGRPKYDFLAKPLRARLQALPSMGSVVVDLTWEPAWTPNRLTDSGRQAMGLSSD